MSYSKRYKKTITVSGSKSETVRYPASQSGGTTSVTVHYTEQVPINIEIDIDTQQFDREVESCSLNVDELTGAVVASETAQIAAVSHHARKVSRTIVDGFFGFIRSEISQQIAELSKSIEAQVMHLNDLRKSCLSKKQQMEGDFTRIASRYGKIFEDLNRELENRIHELDQPAFTFVHETGEQAARVSGTDLVGTVVVFGHEQSVVQAKICVSNAKIGALRAMRKVAAFIEGQREMERRIASCLHVLDKIGRVFVPVCCVETVAADGHSETRLHHAAAGGAMRDTIEQHRLPERLAQTGASWHPMPENEQRQIGLAIKALTEAAYPGLDPHVSRVRETITRMAQLETIHVLG